MTKLFDGIFFPHNKDVYRLFVKGLNPHSNTYYSIKGRMKKKKRCFSFFGKQLFLLISSTILVEQLSH